MRKIHIALILAAIFSIPASFAHQDMLSDSKPCGIIAKACASAGFTRTENSNKRFWKDCMKPIILGQTVEGVTVDSATVKECRMDKIKQLQQELHEFQKGS